VIVHGRVFADIQATPALVLYEQHADLFVLDVRTEAEYANRHIPRAHLIQPKLRTWLTTKKAAM